MDPEPSVRMLRQSSELAVSGSAWRKQLALPVGEQVQARVPVFCRLGEAQVSCCPSGDVQASLSFTDTGSSCPCLTGLGLGVRASSA